MKSFRGYQSVIRKSKFEISEVIGFRSTKYGVHFTIQTFKTKPEARILVKHLNSMLKKALKQN